MTSALTRAGVAVAALLAAAALPAATEFKIATIAPEGSDWMREMRAAAEAIETGSDGRIDIKFYAGGVMGSDKKVLRKMRIGQLHGGAFTSSGLSERYPDIVVYGLPLVFNDADEVGYVRERMDSLLTAGLKEAGLVSLGFAGGGFARLMGSEPVDALGDLRGRKVWVPEGDLVSYVTMQELDLSPVVLPITDVLTGLQTDLLEFVATPAVGAVVLQWYTKVDYVNPMPLAYTLGVLALDERPFGRLSEADQALFREVMGAAYDRLDAKSRADDKAALEALAANGLEFVEPGPGTLEAWRGAAIRAHGELVRQEVISAGILETLLGHLEAYRARNGAAPAAE